MSVTQRLWQISRDAFWQAFFATLLFALVYLLYDREFVRASVEDIAFDIVNRLVISEQATTTNSPAVLLFTIDDTYLRSEKLLDAGSQPDFGYLFPRDHISRFIRRLDKLSTGVNAENRPKALFIDYDMSFSTMPYGQTLSEQDQQLLDTLKQPRSYTVFLPKTREANMIEFSDDPVIQQAITQQKIRFVSVPLLLSSDGVARRYQATKSFIHNGQEQPYLSASLVLWEQLRGEVADTTQRFTQQDIVGNRIWFKANRQLEDTANCQIQQSYWQQLRKYSASCPLFDIVEEDYAGSVIMYGGSYQQNSDRFKVLDIVDAQSFSGVELHANALMTQLHLNGQQHRFALLPGLAIVFSGFFGLSLIISSLFQFSRVSYEQLEPVVILVAVTLVMLGISVYLLEHYKLWFNWFIPVILLQLVKVSFFVKGLLGKLWQKTTRRFNKAEKPSETVS